MAESTNTSSTSNTGIVAMVVVLVIVLVAGLFAWQNGMFGSTEPETKVNIELNSPKPVENPAPIDQPN